MPWKFVCDLRFHEVLQTTIIRQIMKEIEKYSQKDLYTITTVFDCIFQFLHFLSSSAC